MKKKKTDSKTRQWNQSKEIHRNLNVVSIPKCNRNDIIWEYKQGLENLYGMRETKGNQHNGEV